MTNNIIDSSENTESAINLNTLTQDIVITDNIIISNGATNRPVISDVGIENTISNNIILGGDSDDSLTGSAGDDYLNGGAGQDIIQGQSGADVFIFSTKLNDTNIDTNIDTIIDFSSIENDKIGLSDTLFGDFKEGDNWFTAQGEETHIDTRIIQRGDNLYFDADGSGDGYSKVQFAIINQVLTVEDFIIL